MGMFHGFIVAGSERRLVELVVFLLGNLTGRTEPNGLGILHLLVSHLGLRHGLHLELFTLGQILVGLLIGNLLVLRGFLPHIDGEFNELRIPLEQLLNLAAFHVLQGVVLEMEDDARTRRFDRVVGSVVVGNGKLLSGGGLPLELRRSGLHGLGNDLDLVGDEVGGVEANTELANEVDVVDGPLAEGLDEVARAGLGDAAEVVDELVAGHADAAVLDGNGAGVGVGPDLDLGLDGRGTVVGDGKKSPLITGIGGVGYQFAQEDVLVGIQTVDDEVHHPPDLGLELELFLLGFGGRGGLLGGGIGHPAKDGRVSGRTAERGDARADGRRRVGQRGEGRHGGGGEEGAEGGTGDLHGWLRYLSLIYG
mmetsp:Transcript_30392/g.88880  ORF Transcript_30392/g.88880 Transcript_30392/m.88880 type:complete len:365 (+) Transcript_30392:853-1947(+)